MGSVSRCIPLFKGTLTQDLLVASSSSTVVCQERGNAWRASLGKISRTQYLRRYPVVLVQPDGSTIPMKALEPRETVQLAVDLSKLTEDERRQRLAARKPKAKKIVKEEIDDNFDAGDYMKLWATGEETTMTQKKPSPKVVGHKSSKSTGKKMKENSN